MSAIPETVRTQVYQRDGWKCRIPGCGSREDLHPHHIRYKSHGGEDTTENLLTVCAKDHKRIHGTWDDKQLIVLAKSGNPDDTPNANEGLKFKLVSLTPKPAPVTHTVEEKKQFLVDLAKEHPNVALVGVREPTKSEVKAGLEVEQNLATAQRAVTKILCRNCGAEVDYIHTHYLWPHNGSRVGSWVCAKVNEL